MLEFQVKSAGGRCCWSVACIAQTHSFYNTDVLVKFCHVIALIFSHNSCCFHNPTRCPFLRGIIVISIARHDFDRIGCLGFDILDGMLGGLSVRLRDNNHSGSVALVGNGLGVVFAYG